MPVHFSCSTPAGGAYAIAAAALFIVYVVIIYDLDKILPFELDEFFVGFYVFRRGYRTGRSILCQRVGWYPYGMTIIAIERLLAPFVSNLVLDHMVYPFGRFMSSVERFTDEYGDCLLTALAVVSILTAALVAYVKPILSYLVGCLWHPVSTTIFVSTLAGVFTWTYIIDETHKIFWRDQLRRLAFVVSWILFKSRNVMTVIWSTLELSLLHCNLMGISWIERWRTPCPGNSLYKHRQLRHPNEIRLLKIFQRLPRSTLRCELIHVSLDSLPSYEAISYTWGNVTNTPNVILIDGLKFHTTSTVYEILQARSSILGPRLIWIDSICINQKHVEEKNKEVALMRDIFKKASSVLVWLG